MSQISSKSIRKLVTLPPDLAERVEKFRQSIGAVSESDALKALIEDGLKLRDAPADLWQRCLTLTSSGKSIGDIINLVTSEHPLVESTLIDHDFLVVNIVPSENQEHERFRYLRKSREWLWEQNTSAFGGSDWEDITPSKVNRSKQVKELDDEIPF